MRITNRIMQRNNLSNINTNKMYQDRLSTQMSSQKKINRPSDDPVVAIRALRLRSNVTEITQYYSKNIPDAESWLEVTEDALLELADIITNMSSRCNKAVNSDLTTANRKILLEEMQNLGEAIYSTGDADYAGRYVFTGYRTDTPLSFQAAKEQNYTITEQLDKGAIDSVTKVDTDKLLDINSGNYDDGLHKITEDDISSVEVYRIRLAYNDCSDYGYDPATNQNPANSLRIEFTDPTDGKVHVWTGNAPTTPPTPTPPDWPVEEANVIKTMHSYEDPYTVVADDPEAVVYVPETGELLLGKNRYQKLMSTQDSESTANKNEAEIRVTYDKDNWQKGDLRPEHYFYCETEVTDAAGKKTDVVYNDNYLENNAERQIIEYDVGYNQTIRINSTADECFQHGIGREVDDIVNAMQDVLDLEALQTELEKILESIPGGDQRLDLVNKQLEATKKALTLAKNKEQKLFERGITTFKKYLDATNLCVTNCGSRSSKLELVKNRTQNQKTTYETLKSNNEDIDITEVAIELNAAELTYDAALMAAGKVMKTTLLNFI